MSSTNTINKKPPEVAEEHSSNLFVEAFTAWKVIKLFCLDSKKLVECSNGKENTLSVYLKKTQKTKTSSATLPTVTV